MIGILDLQGDVIEHRRALETCGAEVHLVKTAEDLKRVRALVIPGGESTTIGKLIDWYDLASPLRQRIKNGMPVYGTCAGAILLAREITGKETAPNLGLMDIEVKRNAFGRQLDSFEDEITFQEYRMPAVFIRAPKIKSIGKNVEVLAQWGREIVMVREGTILVSTFHPELTDDLTIHRYFLNLVDHATNAQSDLRRDDATRSAHATTA